MGSNCAEIAESIKYDPLHELTIESGYVPAYTELEMNGVFRSDDNKVSFNYPSNWYIDTKYSTKPDSNLNAVVTNTKDLLFPSPQTPFASGQVHITLGYGKIYSDPSTNATYTAEEWLRFMKEASGDGSDITFGEIEATCLSDRPAVRMSAYVEGKNDGFMFAMEDENDKLAYFWLSTAPGELAQWEPTALAIESSLIYHSN